MNQSLGGLTALVFALGITACSGVASDAGANESVPALSSSTSAALPEIVSLFDEAAFASDPKVVDCTLSGGEKTECLSITLNPEPFAFEIGPWCPRHIDDGPDVSGIWLDAGKVYDADGTFIQELDRFYDDDVWQMFDPDTGKIRVTDTKIACAAAARPDVDPAYENYCVECQISFLEPGLTQTYVIPITPVAAQSLQPRVDHAGVGVAFSGARLDASAPTEDILAAHTLAPFDDCGGHVNLHVGYHLHAVTDCLIEVPEQNGHAPRIGIAMDGYPIRARTNADGKEPDDLDACRGHDVSGLGYHYHVNAPGKNAIIGCHSGQTGCALESADQQCDASSGGFRGPPPPGRG